MRIIWWNAGGNINDVLRRDIAKNFMFQEEPQIIFFIESNLNSVESAPVILPEKYNSFSEHKKRIVSFYDRDSGFTPLTDTPDLGLPIHVYEGRQILVAGIYSEYKRYSDDTNYVDISRPQRLRLITNAIKYLLGRAGKKSLILGGDMNIDLTDQTNTEVIKYSEFLQKFNLTQGVTEITRPKSGVMKRNGTLVDHIIYNNFKGECFPFVVGESDHNAVIFTNGKYSRIKNRPKIEMKKVKYTPDVWRWAETNYPFGNMEKEDEWDWSDLEHTIDCFENYMSSAQAIATKTYEFKEGSKFWTPQLTRLKHAANKDVKNVKARNEYQKAVRKAHKDRDNLEMQLKGHPHRDKEKVELKKLKIDGKTITDQKEIAQIMADFFEKKVQDILDMATPDFEGLMEEYEKYNDNRGIKTWEMRPPTKEELQTLIDKLPNKTSCGIDNIPYNLIKYLCEL